MQSFFIALQQMSIIDSNWDTKGIIRAWRSFYNLLQAFNDTLYAEKQRKPGMLCLIFTLCI